MTRDQSKAENRVHGDIISVNLHSDPSRAEKKEDKHQAYDYPSQSQDPDNSELAKLKSMHSVNQD